MTRAFVASLGETIQETQEAWARGAFTADTMEQAHRYNTAALAEVNALRKVQTWVEGKRTANGE